MTDWLLITPGEKGFIYVWWKHASKQWTMYVGVLAVIGLYAMHLWLPQLYEYLFNAKEVIFQLCHVIVSSTFPWSLIWTKPFTYPSNRWQIVRVIRRVQLVEQELLTPLEHLISLPPWTSLSWVRVIHFVTLHCLIVFNSVLWHTVRVPSKTMPASSTCFVGVHAFFR
jgi:hypothetical protein